MVGHAALDRRIGVRIPAPQPALSCFRKLALATCAAGLAIGAWAATPPEDSKWIRVDTQHFTLLSNEGQRQTETIGGNLELLRQALEGTTKGFTLNSPIDTRIYVFADEASFTPFNLGADGKPESLAGYFVPTPDGNYVAFNASAAETPFPIIYHEFLHYVMENTIPGLPLWLNEGLAEFYSSAVLTNGRAQIGLPVDRHLAWLAEHPMLPLRDLFAVDHDSPEYNETERQGTFYAQSWALTHFLIADAERRSRFGRLLEALRQGNGSRESFEQAYGVDLAAVDKALAAYVRASTYTYMRYSPPAGLEAAPPTTRTLERKETLLSLGDLLAHRPPVRFGEAERYTRAALAIDPDMTEGWITLAFLRLMQEKPAEAAEMCERALKLDPRNARTHAMHGQSLFAVFSAGMKDGDPWPETAPPLLVQAREAFRRSLDLRPGDPEALAGLGRTYLFDRNGVDEGLSAMAGAWNALPARTDLLRDLIALTAGSGNVAGAKRLLVALRQRGTAEEIRMAEYAVTLREIDRFEALMRERKIDEARSVLTTLEGELSDPEVASRVREMLTRLDLASAESSEADAYNQAVDAANRGDLEGATTRFEALAAGAADPAMREQAATHASSLRRILKHNRHNAALRAAAEQAAAADYAKATASVEAVLADAPDDQIRESARRMLDELRAQRSGRR